MLTKSNIGFIVLLLFPFWGIAQKCYTLTSRKGDEYFKKGDYQKAIQLWEAAQKCSDKPANNDLDSKISQANTVLKHKPIAKTPGKETVKQTTPKSQNQNQVNQAPPPRSNNVQQPQVASPTSSQVLMEMLKMIKVEGGTFQMGSNDPNHYIDERPVHAVILRGFSMSQFEITQKLWRAVMDGFPEGFKNTNCDNCPMNFVSWHEIQTFLTKLNQKTGKKYRLPTEAEWEYAAKGGTTKGSYSFSGSNDIQKVAWFADNADGKIHTVGSKVANDLGFNDLTGNVQEWCQDFYSETYYKSSAPNNPINTQTAEGCVVRGGSWNDSAEENRMTLRIPENPATKSEKIGFRVVLDF